MNIYPSNYSAMSKSGPDLLTVCREILPALRDMVSYTGADVVVVRGNSGLSVGYVLHTMAPDIEFVVARKRQEQVNSHGHMFEPMGPSSVVFKTYLVLDDLICTGSTLNLLDSDFREESCEPPTLVGVLLYQGHGPLTNRKRFTLNTTSTSVPVWYRANPY